MPLKERRMAMQINICSYHIEMKMPGRWTLVCTQALRKPMTRLRLRFSLINCWIH